MWEILYFQSADGSVPAGDFLDSCPTAVEADLIAVLEAVAEAPPPRFSGGGKWEAMHGTMTGYYEIRVTGPGREQFRLFCLLENADHPELKKRGLKGPAVIVLAGMRKPWRTTFKDRDYRRIRDIGDAHKSNYPRRVAE